jgi:hypothetical protein
MKWVLCASEDVYHQKLGNKDSWNYSLLVIFM